MSLEILTALPEEASSETLPSFVKTPKMLVIERRFGEDGESIGEILNRLHYQENQSLRDMGKTLGVHKHTLIRWGKVLSFTPRSKHEAWMLKKTGPRPRLREALRVARKKMQDRLIAKTFGEDAASNLRWLRSLGFSILEIGQRVGRNKKTISAWMRRVGVDTSRKSWVPERTRYMKRLHLVEEAREKCTLSSLTTKQRQVVDLRYPQTGFPLTFQKIGERLGAVGGKRQLAQEIESYAFRRLKEALK